MAIPYNNHLSYNNFIYNNEWYKDPQNLKPVPQKANPLFIPELFRRSIQFIRDAARLVLKVPVRAVWTPIILKKNWRERERALINVKLTGYSFVHLVSVPIKLVATIASLAVMIFNINAFNSINVYRHSWTAFLDGRASQLEALKEVGLKKTKTDKEYETYKQWVYSIHPALCRSDNTPPQPDYALEV